MSAFGLGRKNQGSGTRQTPKGAPKPPPRPKPKPPKQGK